MSVEIISYAALALSSVLFITSIARTGRLRPSTIAVDHEGRISEVNRRADRLRDLLRENAAYVAALRETADQIEEAGAIAVLDLTVELPHVTEEVCDCEECEQEKAAVEEEHRQA